MCFLRGKTLGQNKCDCSTNQFFYLFSYIKLEEIRNEGKEYLQSATQLCG